jgi:hypothetical protein
LQQYKYNTMASRRSFLSSLPRRLLLAAVLGAVLLHGEAGAMASRCWASPSGRPDRSEAGAEVILAGFAAALIVVIFCYIRVTRESSGGVGVGEKHESLGGF